MRYSFLLALLIAAFVGFSATVTAAPRHAPMPRHSQHRAMPPVVRGGPVARRPMPYAHRPAPRYHRPRSHFYYGALLFPFAYYLALRPVAPVVYVPYPVVPEAVPVEAIPEEREPVLYEEEEKSRKEADRVAALILGTTLGGVIGHQFGGGSGKTAATIGGAVAGGLIADQLSR